MRQDVCQPNSRYFDFYPVQKSIPALFSWYIVKEFRKGGDKINRNV